MWLYNNAGLEYAAAGRHQTAVDWLTCGLRLALETGDAERLVDQLAGARRASLTALGRGEDQLQQEAAAFLAEPRPPRDRPAAMPFAWPADPPRGEPTVPPVRRPVPRTAWAWFPPGEYRRALAAWPPGRT